MRTLFYTTVFLLFLTGCSKNPIEKEGRLDLSDKDLSNIVSTLGFDTTGMSVFGDTILVEGDIILYKSLLAKTRPRQATTTTVTGYSKTHLRIFVPQSLASEENLILDAFREFTKARAEGSTTNLTFEITRAVTVGDVLIRYTTLKDSPGVCAFAEFPTVSGSNLNVGRNITINSRQWRNLNSSQKKQLIIHEFGHCIGLRHTNWIGLGESAGSYVNGQYIGAYTVPGTPNSTTNPDPLSVFNGGTCGHSWNGFSEYDKVAINYLQGN